MLVGPKWWTYQTGVILKTSRTLQQESKDPNTLPERQTILREAVGQMARAAQYCLDNNVGQFDVEIGDGARGTWIPPK